MQEKTLKQFIKNNWMLIAAVVYILSPIDPLPDFVPFLGYSDDVLVLILSLIIRYLKFQKKSGNTIIEGEVVDE